MADLLLRSLCGGCSSRIQHIVMSDDSKIGEAGGCASAVKSREAWRGGGGGGEEGNERDQRDEELSRFHRAMMVMRRHETHHVFPKVMCCRGEAGGRASAAEWRERGGDKVEAAAKATRRWVLSYRR